MTSLELVSALCTFWYKPQGAPHRAEITEVVRSLAVDAPVLVRGMGEAERSHTAERLIGLSVAARDQGDYATSRLLTEQALTVYRELRDERGIADALIGLGYAVYCLGGYAEARACLEQAAAMARKLDEWFLLSWSLLHLGEVTYVEGDYSATETCLAEAMTICGRHDAPWGISYASNILGRVAQQRGDLQRAAAILRENMACRREANARTQAEGLEGMAGLAWAEGQPERAARLFAAARALRETSGSAMTPVDRVDCERHLASVRAVLGEERFAAARAEGQAMSLEQAVADALEGSESARSSTHG